MKISLITVGKLKSDPLLQIWHDYTKRLNWPLTVKEISSSYKDRTQTMEDEATRIINALPKQSYVISLDENGTNMSSKDFAALIEQAQGQNLTFVIGGAFGLSQKVLEKSQKKIAFGPATWPHQLVRVMLVEQLYRAQQILQGHPYHKE